MKTNEAVKIIKDERASAEEMSVARKVLIEAGLMRINEGSYEIKAKADPFLSKIKNGEDWVFAGLVSPYDN